MQWPQTRHLAASVSGAAQAVRFCRKMMSEGQTRTQVPHPVHRAGSMFTKADVKFMGILFQGETSHFFQNHIIKALSS
jgi:hypothetical protein